MSTYFSILTDIGLAKVTNAIATGTATEWTEMAVGDGNGNETTPDQEQTALVRERFRAPINQLAPDPDNPVYLIAELVIPSETGGWTVREVGIFDEDDNLVVVANFPASYKPVFAEGSSKDLAIRIYVEVSSTGAVELKIDPSVVLASRSWVESNFLRRSKVAGGTTGQVLRKKSNAAEDMEWANPTNVNITVNTIQELQTLAASQLIVDFAIITTASTAYYVGGARLEPADYTVNSATRITLAVSYPAGTKIFAVQNDPNTEYTLYEPTTGGGTLFSGRRYMIRDSATYTLQSIAALTNGASIMVTVASGFAPVINVQGGGAEQMRGGNVAPYSIDTTLQCDMVAAMEFTLNKTANFWEIR